MFASHFLVTMTGWLFVIAAATTTITPENPYSFLTMQQRFIRQWLVLYNNRHIRHHQQIEALAAWTSTSCKDFYMEANRPPHQIIHRCTLPSLRVLEDFHPGGRAHPQSGRQPAQEVVVSHEYKFVYVEVRKAASASIRDVLQTAFGANFSWCLYSSPSSSCKLIRGQRCTSLCLTQDMLENYFFFTFVRHPGQRFLAAFHQFIKRRHHTTTTGAISTKNMQLVLLHLLLNHTTADEHIQTQAFALSTSCPGQGQIPLDFIGKIEELDTHWPRLLQAIKEHSGKPLPEPFPSLQNKHQEEDQEKSMYQALATPQIQSLATLTYAQDFVCLGYNPEDWLHATTLDELLLLLS